MRRCSLVAVMALCGLGVVPLAAEAPAEPFAERFAVQVGVMWTSFGSTLRADSRELGEGTTIDLEEDLGLEPNRASFRVDGFWRLAARHRLEVGWTRWQRSGGRAIDKKIVFDDQVYDAHARVHGQLDTDLVRLVYAYSVARSRTVDLTATVGISGYWLRAELDGEVEVGEVGKAAKKAARTVVAPIPMAGLRLQWVPAPRLALGMSGEYFNASLSGRHGEALELGAEAACRVAKPLAIGVAYTWVDLRYHTEEDLDLVFDYRYDALHAFLRFVF